MRRPLHTVTQASATRVRRACGTATVRPPAAHVCARRRAARPLHAPSHHHTPSPHCVQSRAPANAGDNSVGCWADAARGRGPGARGTRRDCRRPLSVHRMMHMPPSTHVVGGGMRATLAAAPHIDQGRRLRMGIIQRGAQCHTSPKLPHTDTPGVRTHTPLCAQGHAPRGRWGGAGCCVVCVVEPTHTRVCASWR